MSVGWIMTIDVILVVEFLIMIFSSSAPQILNDLCPGLPLTRPNRFYSFRWLFRVAFIVCFGLFVFSSLYVEYDSSLQTVLVKNDNSVVEAGIAWCGNDCVNVYDEYEIDNYVQFHDRCAFRFTVQAQISLNHLQAFAGLFEFEGRLAPQTKAESYWILRPSFYQSIEATEQMLIGRYGSVPCDQLPMMEIAGAIYDHLNRQLHTFGYKLNGLPVISWE
ncbi:TPA: hypothetical protein DF272_05275 [Candidatus Falkowbacteria bacterium]|nr:hypothetical protein [Candidatus Falkowbacteria bacterium]